MQVTHQGNNLVQLTRFPRLFPANAYLVREEDGFTLIDTMIPGSTHSVLGASEKLGAPIVRVVLTHAHLDHVGSLDALHEALPEAEVLMSARSARLLAGDLSLDPGEPGEKLPGSWKQCSTRPDREVRPGDRIGALEVVASPGHSPDHISFFDTRDGTLIAGDAFQTRAGVAVSGIVVPLFPFPAMATWHKPTALSSARALRALNPSKLAVGHGRVLTAPLAAMDQAIAEAERRLGVEAVHAG